MAKSKPTSRTVNRPEKKFGPYPGGVSIALWVNQVETQEGLRQFRSVTIAPRRYRDPESGEWKDSTSYRPTDIPALIFGLQKALEFIYEISAGQEDAHGEQPF